MQRFLILLMLGLTALNFDAAHGGRFSSLAEAAEKKPEAGHLLIGSFYDEKARGLRYATEHDPKKVILADLKADVDADVTGPCADLCNITTYKDIPDGRFDEIRMTHIGLGLPINWHKYITTKEVDLGAHPCFLQDCSLQGRFPCHPDYFKENVSLSDIVAQWHRILKPGGCLIWTSGVTVPDIMMDNACGFMRKKRGDLYHLYPARAEFVQTIALEENLPPERYGRLISDELTLTKEIYTPALKGLFDVISFGPEDEKNMATRLVIQRKD